MLCFSMKCRQASLKSEMLTEMHAGNNSFSLLVDKDAQINQLSESSIFVKSNMISN